MSTHPLPYNHGEQKHEQATNFSTTALVQDISKSWWFRMMQSTFLLRAVKTRFGNYLVQPPSELNLEQAVWFRPAFYDYLFGVFKAVYDDKSVT